MTTARLLIDSPRIVVGVGQDRPSLVALRWAAAEARHHRCVLHLVHVSARGRDHRARGHFGRALAAVPEPVGVPVIRTVIHGEPGPGLCAAAHGALLLVVGAHDVGPAERFVLGSVSEYCVRHASGPVVVVPATDAGLHRQPSRRLATMAS